MSNQQPRSSNVPDLVNRNGRGESRASAGHQHGGGTGNQRGPQPPRTSAPSAAAPPQQGQVRGASGQGARQGARHSRPTGFSLGSHLQNMQSSQSGAGAVGAGTSGAQASGSGPVAGPSRVHVVPQSQNGKKPTPGATRVDISASRDQILNSSVANVANNVQNIPVNTNSRAPREPPSGQAVTDFRRVPPVDPNSLNVDILNPQRLENNSGQDRLSRPLSQQLSPQPLHRPENSEALPDILNSHLLPPYTPHRQNQHRPNRQGGPQQRGRQHRRRQPRSRRQTRIQEVDHQPGCCTHCVTVLTTFRWVLVSLAMLGVCCVVTGIVLGALHMTVGSSFLTLSLMFIGLGVMLVVVVGVGWRCTPPGHEPCHLLFNLGEHSPHAMDRILNDPRQGGQWYAGSMYPEFRYRRPPPSYNASMQDYQQQLALAQMQYNPNPGPDGQPNPQRQPGDTGNQEQSDNYSLPSSPPPTYKSQASSVRPGLHITFPPPPTNEHPSRPPTYRSQLSQEGGARIVRPPLPMDGRVPGTAVAGVENTSYSNEQTNNINSNLATNNAQRHVQQVTVNGSTAPYAGSTNTLDRANQVVQYLDGVLASQGVPSTTSGSSVAQSVNTVPGRPRPQNAAAAAEHVADTHL